MKSTRNATNWVITALVVVIFASVLASTMFGYLGSGGADCSYNTTSLAPASNVSVQTCLTQGLGNATANPFVPTWLAPVIIVALGIGLLYLVLKVLGILK